MTVRTILRLGDPRLYEPCAPVQPDEVEAMRTVAADLHDTMLAFRAEHGWGRAIAAPQIGVMKRLVYMHLDGESYTFINPVIDQHSRQMMTLWDDCMSFPHLLVKLDRHATCRLTYRDRDWNERKMPLSGDLSELLQHEVDHLDGVLTLSRAHDDRAIIYRSERPNL